jgi:hypothetical protein
VAPLREMSPRVNICTGNAESDSKRGMLEPVTWILIKERASSADCWASAEPATLASSIAESQSLECLRMRLRCIGMPGISTIRDHAGGIVAAQPWKRMDRRTTPIEERI